MYEYYIFKFHNKHKRVEKIKTVNNNTRGDLDKYQVGNNSLHHHTLLREGIREVICIL